MSSRVYAALTVRPCLWSNIGIFFYHPDYLYSSLTNLVIIVLGHTDTEYNSRLKIFPIEAIGKYLI